MPSPRYLSILATAVILAAPGAGARAQDTRELARRLDAAVALREKATATLVAYRRQTDVAQVYSDTIRIADRAMLVVTTGDFLPVVRAAAVTADTFIRRSGGSQVGALRGTVVTVRVDTTVPGKAGVVISLRSNGLEGAQEQAPASRDAVAKILESRAQELLLAHGGVRSREWLTGGLPIDTMTDSDWRAVRLEMVSSPTTIARTCYGGDIPACKATLGLTVVQDPVMDMYDAEGRRAVIARVRHFGQLARGTTDRCVAGDDAQCINLMRTNAALFYALAPEGSGHARATLMQQAIADGGPGAIERLIMSKGSVSDEIAAAAREPLDSVIVHWQRHARLGGIKSDDFSPAIAAIAIGWILALGAVAVRGSRWR